MRIKEKLYQYGLVFIAYFISVILLFNNIKYRMITRKREMNIYRAIGMKVKRLKYLARIEGVFYGLISTIILLISTVIGTYSLYNRNANYLEAYDIGYHLPLLLFFIISVINMLLIIIISQRQMEKTMGSDIIPLINGVE